MDSATSRRYDHESAQSGNCIYLFGGWNGRLYFSPREIRMFDIRNRIWHLRRAGGRNAPPYCYGARCVVIDRCIYSYGGWTGSECVPGIYCLDLEKMEWELVDTRGGVQPEGRYFHCFCVVGSKTVMFGGLPFKCGDQKLYELKVKRKGKGVWKVIEMSGGQPGPHYGAAMVEIDRSRALVHGGFQIDSGYLSDFFVIDLEKKKWSRIEFKQQPSPRNGHTLCRLGRRACFLLAGGNGDKPFSDHSYILDFEEIKAYKIEEVEPISGHTAHHLENSRGTPIVMLLGGIESYQCQQLRPFMTALSIGPNNEDLKFCLPFLTEEPEQPSPVVSQERYQRLDERCSDLEKEVHQNNVLLREKDALLSEKDALLARAEADRAKAESKQEELATQCRNLQDCLTQSIERLNEFTGVLSIAPNQIYLTDRKMGSGAFASVYVGRWHGMPVAVKKFHELTTSPRNSEFFLREVLVCSRLHHPNIVAVCGAVVADGVRFQIVSELLEGTVSELMDAAHATGCYLSANEQLSIAMETNSAIAYLQQLRPEPYVHGDIRPTNILVARDMKVKVGDLGAARLLGSSLSAGPLSPLYLAPERMPRDDGTAASSSLKSDVYSLGVTLIEIFTGIAPIVKERKIQLEAISNLRWQYTLCSKMIASAPDNRPSAQECLALMEREESCTVFGILKRMVIGRFDGNAHKVMLLDCNPMMQKQKN